MEGLLNVTTLRKQMREIGPPVQTDESVVTAGPKKRPYAKIALGVVLAVVGVIGGYRTLVGPRSGTPDPAALGISATAPALPTGERPPTPAKLFESAPQAAVQPTPGIPARTGAAPMLGSVGTEPTSPSSPTDTVAARAEGGPQPAAQAASASGTINAVKAANPCAASPQTAVKTAAAPAPRKIVPARPVQRGVPRFIDNMGLIEE